MINFPQAAAAARRRRRLRRVARIPKAIFQAPKENRRGKRREKGKTTGATLFLSSLPRF